MDMANQFLSLALFIMLLSFFIILNALSNFEDVKSKPVLSSIAMTFSDKSPEQILSPNTVESVLESNKEGDTLSKLEALFNAHITGIKTRKNRLGTMMKITIPITQFESSLLAPARKIDPVTLRFGAPGTFVPTLLSLMQTRETEIPYRMDMVLNTKQNPSSALTDNPQKLKADMEKVSTYSKRLVESGLPKKLISGGLGIGNPEMVDIYFTRYQPVNPLQNNSRGG